MTVFVNAILYYKGICICICICKRNPLLQSEERDARGCKRGRLQRVCETLGCDDFEERLGNVESRGHLVSGLEDNSEDDYESHRHLVAGNDDDDDVYHEHLVAA